MFRCFDGLKPAYRFLILLLLMSILYQYPFILFKRPQSVHHWRQSDCASLALNYYQTGMHFFQPQTHNLTSDGNTTGFVATSEIPIGYYFIAILYKIFGFHDYIYRIVNTIIFLTGLLFLFKVLSILLEGFFWPAFLALFFFTSPVLVFYGNNYLTDSSALAFALMAWYFFVRYYQTSLNKTYYISMILFLLAGAYKITALMSVFAILGIFIIELIGIANFRDKDRLFLDPIRQILPFIVIFAVIGAWVAYAKYYNRLHSTWYFSTFTLPLWNLDKDGVLRVIKNVRQLWLNQYFSVEALYLMAILFFGNLVLIRKGNRLLLTTTFFLFLGTILYGILWFVTFEWHDYYTINLYILLVFNVIAFAWLMNKHYRTVLHSKYLKIGFFIFFLINVIHADRQMDLRYNGWFTQYPEYRDYYTITPYLRSIGIQPLDTVICLPDGSHCTLYLMNLRGWTECLGNNRDRASVEASVKRGAKYLIVNGDEILKRDYLQGFLYHPFGQYGSVRIFKLD